MPVGEVAGSEDLRSHICIRSGGIRKTEDQTNIKVKEQIQSKSIEKNQ